MHLPTLATALAALLISPALAQCGAGDPDASVTGSDGEYTATMGSKEIYAGSDYHAAIQGALDAVASGQRVAVVASGSIGARSITVDSGKTLEGCGTIDIEERAGHGAVESLGTTGARIPYLRLRGSAYFAMYFYGARDLVLGDITMDLTGGIGIRFARDEAGSTNVKMGTVTVTGAGSHAVETWNINGLEIDTVVARDCAESGLLLQNSRNVHVGLVDGNNTGTGTGYAALRFANKNGITADDDYATNVYVDKVVATGGGRGFFCVSESGGAEIGDVELSDNGSESILIQNCYNVKILGGTVRSGGQVRIGASSEFENTHDISITADVSGTTVEERPCGDHITWNLTGNARKKIC